MRARRPDRAARDAPGAGAQMEQSAPLLPGPCHVFFEKSAPPRWPWFMASPTLHPLSDSESEFNGTKTPARIQKKVHGKFDMNSTFDANSFIFFLCFPKDIRICFKKD
jgi:hypothetical protein